MRRNIVCLGLLIAACTSPPSTVLFAHPWPDERLRAPDGTVDVTTFPEGAPIRDEAVDALRGVRGMGVSSGIFFPFDVPLDPSSLPSVEESTAADASVFVVNVDERSPERGRRAPVDVRFFDDAGPFGGTNLLVVLPYPGLPLAPRTRYAAVVTTRVRDADGRALSPSTEARPDVEVGEEIAAIAVIETDDPTEGLRDAYAQAAQENEVLALKEAPTLTEEYPEYCVFDSVIEVPVYQAGEPPYESRGGGWAMAPDGTLVLQRVERARLVITVPRAPMPAEGHPAAVFVRAGGGGDRPLVDRGPHDAQGHAEPGSGLARDLALAGYVGVSTDGPLGGIRNTGDWDEQFVLFNVINPIALRDNVRQYALELALLAPFLERLDFDASACAGASPRVHLAPGLALIAHSNGATIAPLAAAVEPRYRALVLSGAGASWIRQVVYKQSPMPLRPLASLLFGYGCDRETFEHDPMLSLLTWAGEPADPLVYAHWLRDRDVLVIQGVLDTYIPPPVANPLALSMDLDLAGDALDGQLASYGSIVDDLRIAGGAHIALPARGNDGEHTRVVVQLPEDGIEDGHEVQFQLASARRQLRCFLATLRDGAPIVVSPDDPEGACPF